MDLISIIVPVYNVSKYLRQCVDSIINQTYQNLEIILVDDGSPDDSGMICDEYAEKDCRIKVIHKKNGGLSDARNAGIKVANGMYICFIDSDDYVSEIFIEHLYTNAKKYDVNVSCCGFCRFFDSGKMQHILFENVQREYYGEEIQKYLNIDGYFNVAVWNKMYKKELFNSICFPVGKNSEDAFVMYRILEKADSLYYDSTELYYYRQRYGSITKSSTIVYDTLESNTIQLKYYKKRGWTEAVKFGAQRLLLANIGVYNTALCNPKTFPPELLKTTSETVNKLRYEYSNEGLSKARKIQINLFIYCRPVYNFVFRTYNFLRMIMYQ